MDLLGHFLAHMAAFMVGTIFSFYINSRLTFPAKTHHRRLPLYGVSRFVDGQIFQ
ncbi:MAG TPA: hypothetical protein EYO53_07280 [Alphaproteobacteria bacterium]|nr:hypothetical protein [Alphaproteobacteria bacterium]